MSRSNAKSSGSGIACARSKGPVAEEIRIQILEWFAQPDSPSTRMSERRAVLTRVPVRTAQIHRIGERGSNATL